MPPKDGFLRAGFLPQQICNQVRVLGVDIFAPGADPVGRSQQSRVQEGLVAAARLAQAPVAPQIRGMLYRIRVIPKICWGWWVNVVPIFLDTKVFSIFRQVADVHKMASRHLRLLLHGHVISFPFMACQQSLTALRNAGMPWHQANRTNGAWVERVISTLQLWDWQNVAPWQWHHPSDGGFDLCMMTCLLFCTR